MKPIIAFDMDGTLLKKSIADTAHSEWFRVIGAFLKDDSIVQLADKKDNSADVLGVMEKLTGLDKIEGLDRSIMIRYARSLYQMIYLAELKKQGQEALVKDILDLLVDLKGKCMLALITTEPEDVVLPALSILKIKNIFDYVYRSPADKEPFKADLIRKFIKEVGKPALYIGNEKADGEACREIGLKFALAKWDRFDEDAEEFAKFNLTEPMQLKGVINLL
jgi:phosphoglycolate phosphatase-like HAD superfamily hydrolase